MVSAVWALLSLLEDLEGGFKEHRRGLKEGAPKGEDTILLDEESRIYFGLVMIFASCLLICMSEDLLGSLR